MNSVMVMCAPRCAAQAPPRKVTHTISSSPNSVTQARSLWNRCRQTLMNTIVAITAPMVITTQSTIRPSRRMGSGAGATGLSMGVACMAVLALYLVVLRMASASASTLSTSAPYFSRALS